MDTMDTDQEVYDKLLKDADAISLDLLPDKSRQRYLNTYDKFMQWKVSQKIGEFCFTEPVMLFYFNSLKANYKPSTIWVRYSMLKSVIQRNHIITIKYPQLEALLRKNSVGYEPKRSNVFRPDEVARFLSEAPDQQFLEVKVALIFGIYGATRGDELTRVDVKDVRAEGNMYVVKIPVTKTHKSRMFTVDNEYAVYMRKYINLRPANVPHTRFFLNFQKGKCTQQPIGRNKFLGMPRCIADFLQLEEPQTYTGHSFRRTSATLLSDGGADVMALKNHGGWKSLSTVEGYIEQSVGNKRKIGGIIEGQLQGSNVAGITTSTVRSLTVTSTDTSATTAVMLSQTNIVEAESVETSGSTTVILSQSNVLQAESATIGVKDELHGGIHLHNCPTFVLLLTFIINNLTI